MKIVMPLFDFINGSGREFEFGNGAYRLRRFDPNTSIPIDGRARFFMNFIDHDFAAYQI